MERETADLSEQLRSRIEELGLELRLRRLGTPGQLAFAVPIRGLDYWQARLLRDGRMAAHGEGVSREAAVSDALRAFHRP
jgi:hypothetical protein